MSNRRRRRNQPWHAATSEKRQALSDGTRHHHTVDMTCDKVGCWADSTHAVQIDDGNIVMACTKHWPDLRATIETDFGRQISDCMGPCCNPLMHVVGGPDE